MERFREFKEEDNFSAFRRDRRRGSKFLDFISCGKIQEDFYKVFGFSEDFQTLRKLKRELAALQAERMTTKKREVENRVNIKLQQIRDIEKKFEGEGLGIMRMKAAIDKHFSYVNLRDITVLDFYTKLKIIEENGRSIKKD